ncbi:MAG: hypothetical protein ACREPM_19110 [Gemmatimonadaceae bacterium]
MTRFLLSSIAASFDPSRGTTSASIKRSMLRPRFSSAESPAAVVSPHHGV